ncbi:ABC transporter ATP-binding protein [Desulfogranum mediterraneum]|uniref:ABC transporter ATP-binding protein n=1 Tax=Desulfogranum mediterraneum TaxID=160661 RepID=UPI00041CA024|nr:ABC transporter ATP-binding protein [Desulfogranum mediterraneum]
MSDQKSLLQLEGVCKSFGPNLVAAEVSFSLEKGEIGCLLGPSGCGKTTLLRVVAGFESIDQGRVIIDGTTVSTATSHLAPEKRTIGMVFQDYALFPHLSVADNVAFGIRNRPGRQRRRKVAELLELVGLAGQSGRYPHEISGGQQQRVALARALAPEPELLLLDEPFSNLDALLRERLTVEVRDILKSLQTTALLVTHNQHEAFSVADSIGVMFAGAIQQWDRAHDIYHRPASLAVATFVGDGTLISGTVEGPGTVRCGLGVLRGDLSLPCSSGSGVDLLLRPEDVLHVEDAEIQARVVHKSFRGPTILYQLELTSGEQCQALVSSHHNHGIGQWIGIVAEVDNLVIFPQEPA